MYSAMRFMFSAGIRCLPSKRLSNARDARRETPADRHFPAGPPCGLPENQKRSAHRNLVTPDIRPPLVARHAKQIGGCQTRIGKSAVDQRRIRCRQEISRVRIAEELHGRTGDASRVERLAAVARAVRRIFKNPLEPDVRPARCLRLVQVAACVDAPGHNDIGRISVRIEIDAGRVGCLVRGNGAVEKLSAQNGNATPPCLLFLPNGSNILRGIPVVRNEAVRNRSFLDLNEHPGIAARWRLEAGSGCRVVRNDAMREKRRIGIEPCSDSARVVPDAFRSANDAVGNGSACRIDGKARSMRR